MQKLILFDLDGTVLWTAGAGRRAINAAVLKEVGAGAFDGIRFDGKTDPQIVSEMLAAAGRPSVGNREIVERIFARYLELLEGELADGEQRTTLFPGVADLLDLIEARNDSLLGLLTGNLEGGARLKLEAAGVEFERFRVGAFGSDDDDRARLPPIAAKRAVPLMGRMPSGADIVIVGDTPADMTCGRSVGARALGVTTGRYSKEELLAAGGFAVFEDLRDNTSVLAAIYA